MVSGNMAYFSRIQSLKSSLIISVAFSLTLASQSQAQSYQSYPDVVLPASSANNPSYSSGMSLPNLTPDQIAADVVAQYDPLTGRTEYTAPDFDPFEQEADLAGTVRLRSASSGISRDGANVNGGAYLDITVLYSSASRDPYDAKGLEHAVYMNGRPVDVMTYDVQALDCQSDVTYVSYDDSYYRGASYGYLGGLYRPFPRYRGGRYGRQCDLIRYGSWRGLRDRYVGYYGYDNRYDRRVRDRGRALPGSGRFDREPGIGDGNANRDFDRNERQERRDAREREQRRNLELRMRDQVSVSTRNVVRPDQLGDRLMTDPVAIDTSLRPISSDGVASGSGGSTATSAPDYGSRRGYNRSQIDRRDQLERVRDAGARAGVPRLGNATPRLGNATPRLGNSTPRLSEPSRTAPVIDRSRERSRTERRRDSDTKSNTRRTMPVTPPKSPRSTESRSSESRSTRSSRSSSRSTTRTTTSRTNRSEPRVATPKRETRPAPRPATPPKSRSSSSDRSSSSSNRSSSSSRSSNRSSNRSSSSSRSSRSSTRSVNRSFESRNKSTPRTRRYYSGGTYTDRYETTRCIKEERITLHIPADRLEAARFDGLSIALLDQHGNDIPLYIPPNYIEGFSKANPYLGSYSSAYPQPYSGSQSYGHPSQQPAPYTGGYPTNPGR